MKMIKVSVLASALQKFQTLSFIDKVLSSYHLFSFTCYYSLFLSFFFQVSLRQHQIDQSKHCVTNILYFCESISFMLYCDEYHYF